MVVTSEGKIIRTQVGGISELGRATQGVRLIRLGEDEVVVGTARIDDPEVVEEAEQPEPEELEADADEGDEGDDDEADEETDDEVEADDGDDSDGDEG